jgi:hypothetical protein
MNRKKYISAILVLLAFAGSTVLLKLSAMNRTTQGNDSSDWQPDMPVPMDLEQDFDVEDIDSPIAPAQGNDPQWFSEITESISHNRIHEAIARIRALDQRNINYQDRDGWTLLHWAVLMRGRWDVCMELLQKGINKNLMNQDGETAADMADELQNPDLANMLNGYK